MRPAWRPRRFGVDGRSWLLDGNLRSTQAQFPLVTVFAAYNGENYADIPTVQRTVGFIPRETRAEREERTY